MRRLGSVRGSVAQWESAGADANARLSNLCPMVRPGGQIGFEVATDA